MSQARPARGRECRYNRRDLPKLRPNTLYYGDNLEALRDQIPDESVDLIYLDPPLNSNRSYNVLFKEAGKGDSPAQIDAFEDTWHRGESANCAFEEVAMRATDDPARLLTAKVDALGHNDVTAYLSMMAVRLIELHRVLKLLVYSKSSETVWNDQYTWRCAHACRRSRWCDLTRDLFPRTSQGKGACRCER